MNIKTTFTETIQSYFKKKQKEIVIERVMEQLKSSFDQQAYELSKKLYENYKVDIVLKENPDNTLTAMTVIRLDDTPKESSL